MSSTKYHTTPENVKKKIKKYGVAIIPNLLNEDECNMMKTGMWDYLEHVSQQWENPLSKDNVNSWKEFSNLYPKHSMLLQQFEIGHTQLMWNLRQNPKCVNVFSLVLSCWYNRARVSSAQSGRCCLFLCFLMLGVSNGLVSES